MTGLSSIKIKISGIAIVLCCILAACQKPGKYDDWLIEIEGGSFLMGSRKFDDAQPVHVVKVSDFKLSKYEVTNKQFVIFLNDYGSGFVKTGKYKGKKMVDEFEFGIVKTGDTWTYPMGFGNNPVVNVTWYGAYTFCEFYGYRLPSEAEWEFAARGGIYANGYRFAGSDSADLVAWYRRNTNGLPSRVGMKKPNELGLYDMSGNVWEWCNDFYTKNYQMKISESDTIESKTCRILRGGSWYVTRDFLDVSYRQNGMPYCVFLDYGFRFAR